MSKWLHSICDRCWKKRSPDFEPHRLVDADEERCCFCGSAHYGGIFIRLSPDTPELKCKGDHSN